MLKYILYTMVLISVVYNIILFYVDKNMESRLEKTKDVYKSCHKIWSSRGIYKTKKEQNSIKAFKEAIKAGYVGFEVDFYYDKDKKKFIISHNKPKKDKDGKLIYSLKDGELLTLEKLFKEIGNGHYFWLDYKNLDRICKETTLESIKRLEKITKLFEVKKRVYIEGSRPDMLSYYSQKGFKTIIAFQPLPESNILTSLSSNIYKMIFYFSDVSAIAIQYGKRSDPKYNKTTSKNLKGIPQFLFHVPANTKLLKSLYQKEDVRVMLVGRDQSVDFAGLNCVNKK